jgi:UDP-GlcNAc:undecaprenyl-phosphate/decaprenyl-phosphate GlcNAc-1-phosphate transferase
MVFLSTLLLSIFITIALIPLCSRVAVRAQALDVPDERKVHTVPVPRCGGVAMALGSLVPVLVWVEMTPQFSAYLMGCAILSIAGIYDDFKGGLSVTTKFMAQVAAALVLVFYGGIVIRDVGNVLPRDMDFPYWLAAIVTVFVVVGVTNAINLADGLDGLAGGISLLIFLFISFLAYGTDSINIAIVALSLSGALFGFLRFNTHPAKLFMGDTGSMLLGFSAVALCIRLTQTHSPFSPVLPLILLGFPILDTLTVMAQRISEGRSPFSPDKNHFHHRLLRLGFFQTEAVFIIYAIQVLLVLSAWFFRFYSEWFLLLSYVIFSTLMVGFFTLADKTNWQFKRYDVIDRVVKGKLRKLRGRRLPIRFSFRGLSLVLPALLVVLTILPESIPGSLSILSGCFAALLILMWLIRKEWLGRVLMLCVYIFVPLIVYAGEMGKAPWASPLLVRGYSFLYILLVFFALMTLRFTGRKEGFHITPMDFIVMVLAIGLTALPREMFPEAVLKNVIPMILALFLGYEVLAGELRGNIQSIVWVTIISFIIVGIRGFI